MLGLQHFHLRKRIHKKHEAYPHPQKGKRMLDKIITPIVLLGPLVFLPQVIKVWVEKDASSLSPFTWIAITIIGIVWFIYGVVHKEPPIILAYTGYTILNTLMVI